MGNWGCHRLSSQVDDCCHQTSQPTGDSRASTKDGHGAASNPGRGGDGAQEAKVVKVLLKI